MASEEIRLKIRGSIARALEAAKKQAEQAAPAPRADVNPTEVARMRESADARTRIRDFEAAKLAPPEDLRRTAASAPVLAPNPELDAVKRRGAQAQAEFIKQTEAGADPTEAYRVLRQAEAELERLQMSPSRPPDASVGGQLRREEQYLRGDVMFDEPPSLMFRGEGGGLPSPVFQDPVVKTSEDVELLSDERAKKNVEPSPLTPHVGGPMPGVALQMMSPRRGIAARGPMAPSKYMQTAARMGHGERTPSVELGPAFKDEVAESRVKPKNKSKGLAENDAERRKQALDFMQFAAALPQFGMVDVGGRYRG